MRTCAALLLLLAACGSSEPVPQTAQQCAEAYFRAQMAWDVDGMMRHTVERSREKDRAQIESELLSKRELIDHFVITITGERVSGNRSIISFHQVTYFKDGRKNEFNAERQLVFEEGRWWIL